MAGKRLLGIIFGISMVVAVWWWMDINNLQQGDPQHGGTERNTTLTFPVKDHSALGNGGSKNDVDKSETEIRNSSAFENGQPNSRKNQELSLKEFVQDNGDEKNKHQLDVANKGPGASSFDASEKQVEPQPPALPQNDKYEYPSADDGDGSSEKTVHDPDPENDTGSVDFQVSRHFFWKPFQSQFGANGFAKMITSSSGVLCNVEKEKPLRYRVYFDYLDDEDRVAKIARIEEKAAIKLEHEDENY